MNRSSAIRLSSSFVISGGMSVLLAVFALLLIQHHGSLLSLRTARIFDSHLTLSSALFTAVFAVMWQSTASALVLYENPKGGWRASLSRIFYCTTLMCCALALYVAVVVPGAPVAKISAIFATGAIGCELVLELVSGRSTRSPHRVIIVGSDRLAAKAWRELRTEPLGEMELVGFVDDTPQEELMPDVATRYLGDTASLPELVLKRDIDDVIVAKPLVSGSTSSKHSISLAGGLGVRILCVKDICGIAPAGITKDYGESLFELAPAPHLGGVAHAVRRSIDVVTSLAALLPGALFLLSVCATGFLYGPRVIFGSELCIGFRRRKYRKFCVRSAPGGRRVWLWLDVLAQVGPVLRGDMSLVGPRALLEQELLELDPIEASGRFDVRPGITGTLGLHGRFNESEWDGASNGAQLQSFRAELKLLAKALHEGIEPTPVVETSGGSV